MSTAHASQVTPRRGFTLIELLMVILLIGILASLLLVAIRSALITAQNAAVTTEIDQMSTAIESYKGERGAYPLTLGEPMYDTGFTSDPAGQRMSRHIAKAFPRYTGDSTKFSNDVLAGTAYFAQATPPRAGLDWRELDPAESLVFWLGGFPDPNSETKLLGFRKDPANPFRYPPPTVQNPNPHLQNRTAPLFPFKPERLVDRDEDGWWEYIQDGTAEGDMPPYVYFDPTTYNLRPFYPVDPNSRMPKANTVSWGHAVPYAMSDTQKSFPTTNKIQWANSQKFQIVAPGRDGSYGRAIYQPNASPVATEFDPDTATLLKIARDTRLYPTCDLLRPVNGDPVTLLPDTELDNLTNFTSGKLGDEKE